LFQLDNAVRRAEKDSKAVFKARMELNQQMTENARYKKATWSCNMTSAGKSCCGGDVVP